MRCLWQKISVQSDTENSQMHHSPSEQSDRGDRTNKVRAAALTRNKTKLDQTPPGSGQASVQQQNTKYSRKIHKLGVQFRVSRRRARYVNKFNKKLNILHDNKPAVFPSCSNSPCPLLPPRPALTGSDRTAKTLSGRC